MNGAVPVNFSRNWVVSPLQTVVSTEKPPVGMVITKKMNCPLTIPAPLALLMLTKRIVSKPGGSITGKLSVEEEVTTGGWFTLLIEYDRAYGPPPVRLTVTAAMVPLQTVSLPLTKVAVGIGSTEEANAIWATRTMAQPSKPVFRMAGPLVGINCNILAVKRLKIVYFSNCTTVAMAVSVGKSRAKVGKKGKEQLAKGK